MNNSFILKYDDFVNESRIAIAWAKPSQVTTTILSFIEEKQTKLGYKEKMAEHPNMEVKDEAAEVKKEEKMQEGDSARLDSLEAAVNQLRQDIAQLFEGMKKEEEMGMEINDEKEKVKAMDDCYKNGKKIPCAFQAYTSYNAMVQGWADVLSEVIEEEGLIKQFEEDDFNKRDAGF